MYSYVIYRHIQDFQELESYNKSVDRELFPEILFYHLPYVDVVVTIGFDLTSFLVLVHLLQRPRWVLKMYR